MLDVGAQKALGSLTLKANEYLINVIMRQSNHSGVMETVGFPKQASWLRDNFMDGLLLEEYLMGKLLLLCYNLTFKL